MLLKVGVHRSDSRFHRFYVLSLLLGRVHVPPVTAIAQKESLSSWETLVAIRHLIVISSQARGLVDRATKNHMPTFRRNHVENRCGSAGHGIRSCGRCKNSSGSAFECTVGRRGISVQRRFMSLWPRAPVSEWRQTCVETLSIDCTRCVKVA
jgi:hypothetical protein